MGDNKKRKTPKNRQTKINLVFDETARQWVYSVFTFYS